jgi:dTMP kinase
MNERYHGDESKKDVHEKDVEYLTRSRRAAEYCAAQLGWKTVACNEGDVMRTIDEIGAEVEDLARQVVE